VLFTDKIVVNYSIPKYTMSVDNQEKNMCIPDIEFLMRHTIESYARRRRHFREHLPDNVKGTDDLAHMITMEIKLDDGSDLTLERAEEIYTRVLERMWLSKGDTFFAKMGYTSGSEDFLDGLRNKLDKHKSGVHCNPIM
jgi:hypothetical protein